MDIVVGWIFNSDHGPTNLGWMLIIKLPAIIADGPKDHGPSEGSSRSVCPLGLGSLTWAEHPLGRRSRSDPSSKIKYQDLLGRTVIGRRNWPGPFRVDLGRVNGYPGLVVLVQIQGPDPRANPGRPLKVRLSTWERLRGTWIGASRTFWNAYTAECHWQCHVAKAVIDDVMRSCRAQDTWRAVHYCL